MKLNIISQNIIKKCVSMAEAIDAVKEAFIQLALKEALVPQRIQIPIKEQEGISLFMPAYLARSGSLGMKLVSVFPKNIELGLPTIHAIVIVVDSTTGRAEAVMDGTYLTALRTGAASGVATNYLARKQARAAAVFGAGVQGRTQLEAILTVRDVEKVWIFDKNPAAALSLAEESSREKTPHADIFVAQTPSQALREADIVCTATTSSIPVFDDADLKAGVHINGIGSYTPDMQEIPEHTVARSKIVVDSLRASLEEAGDLIIPLKKGMITEEKIHGEIGQVASGRIPGRETEEEVTLFKSVGVAVQDVALAELILSRAKDLGLGEEVEV